MTSLTRPVNWVVGSRGLLGSAVRRHVGYADLPLHTSIVPWEDAGAAVDVLESEALGLLGTHPWVRLLWCAGAGVMGTGPEALARELDVLTEFFERLAAGLERREGARMSVFLASSAGGVYAGSDGGLFTERTPPRPLSPYGENKLAAEQILAGFADRTGTPLLIGRIANLYGPGQDLRKAQGLISQLCRSHVQRRPLMVYVPLDTARDYVYVDDAAQMILAALRRVESAPEPEVVVKIIASGRATTLASVIGELRRVTKHRPPIVLGASPQSRVQASQLRFRSVLLPEVDQLARTPLPAGILATYAHVAAQLRRPA